MSANAKFWSNVTIDVQTALGSAQDISGITKADPGVITYVGADPAKRSARLALLERVRAAVHNVADFSRIEG